MSGPVNRRRFGQIEHEEWFYTEPPDEPFFESDFPTYSNPSTQAVATFVLEDPKYQKATSKWVMSEFNRTFDIDAIHNELIDRFMGDVIDGAHKLGSPYEFLVIQALQDVDWDQLAAHYTHQLGGTYSPEQTHLEKALQVLPGEEDEAPWLSESDYYEIPPLPSKRDRAEAA
jgi:hypothetical protein